MSSEIKPFCGGMVVGAGLAALAITIGTVIGLTAAGGNVEKRDQQASTRLHHKIMVDCHNNNCPTPLQCADNAVEFFVGEKEFLREHISNRIVRGDLGRRKNETRNAALARTLENHNANECGPEQ